MIFNQYPYIGYPHIGYISISFIWCKPLNSYIVKYDIALEVRIIIKNEMETF